MTRSAVDGDAAKALPAVCAHESVSAVVVGDEGGVSAQCVDMCSSSTCSDECLRSGGSGVGAGASGNGFL